MAYPYPRDGGYLEPKEMGLMGHHLYLVLIALGFQGSAPFKPRPTHIVLFCSAREAWSKRGPARVQS